MKQAGLMVEEPGNRNCMNAVRLWRSANCLTNCLSIFCSFKKNRLISNKLFDEFKRSIHAILADDALGACPVTGLL